MVFHKGVFWGPLLFFLYVNDMPNVVDPVRAHITLFADDTTVATSDPDHGILLNNAHVHIEALHTWTS